MNECVEMAIEMAREYVQEPTDRPRHVAVDALVDAALVPKFAETIVQLADACVIGLPCDRHGGAAHGQEAEELRAGIERILGEHGPTSADVPYKHADYEGLRSALIRLLDEIDARDSLGFLEARDKEDDACV